MASILIQITSGPNEPTKAALGFLICKTGLEEGHEVNLFLAGDAVLLIKEGILENLTGLGTGRLIEYYEQIIAAGVIINLSKMSCDARGISDEYILDKPLKKCKPTDLLGFALSSDKVLAF